MKNSAIILSVFGLLLALPGVSQAKALCLNCFEQSQPVECNYYVGGYNIETDPEGIPQACEIDLCMNRLQGVNCKGEATYACLNKLSGATTLANSTACAHYERVAIPISVRGDLQEVYRFCAKERDRTKIPDGFSDHLLKSTRINSCQVTASPQN